MTREELLQKANVALCDRKFGEGYHELFMRLGMLHDPEEVARGKEALEALVALRTQPDGFKNRPGAYDAPLAACLRLADAELERRKPRPRWTAEQAHAGMWRVRIEREFVCDFPYDAEPEARAYVARKNAEEAK